MDDISVNWLLNNHNPRKLFNLPIVVGNLSKLLSYKYKYSKLDRLPISLGISVSPLLYKFNSVKLYNSNNE